MNIKIGKEVCINPEAALRREWLDTNGLGGYASSTVINCHTRKYHGLLVAALQDPPGRYVLLSKVDASISVGRHVFHLSTNKYPGVFFPTGHKYIEYFSYRLFPTIVYRIGEILVEKSVLLLHGENTVLIRYHLRESGRPLVLRLRPLLAYRNIHALARENMELRVKTYFEKNGFKIDPYEGMPPLYCRTNRKSTFHPSPEWFYNVEYMKERRRGYEYQEDLFSPGVLEIPLSEGTEILFAASTKPHHPGTLRRKYREECARREREFHRFDSADPRLQDLKYLSHQFFITRHSGKRFLAAGYHWFGPWGRDTMVSLPGLAFHTGRMEEGVEVLRTFLSLERGGLLPNFISENGEPAYNSADASLWFFWTVQQYLAQGGDTEIVHGDFFPVMSRIIGSVINGTSPMYTLMGNGTVGAGNERTQLTWMDAVVRGVPVTPRHGCAVEINALWYNALMFYIELLRTRGEKVGAKTEDTALRLEKSFPALFWNENAHCLFDVVRGEFRDPSVRPNQILAVSLPYSPLPQDMMKAVMVKVAGELLTPYGIRSLSPADPAFHPRYEGSQEERDAAYHQGTVWPWLVAHFGEGYLKVCESFEAGKRFLESHLDPLLTRFPADFGICSIPEIYNGSPPYKPKGCISQAWSLAELIRLHAILEKGTKP